MHFKLLVLYYLLVGKLTRWAYALAPDLVRAWQLLLLRRRLRRSPFYAGWAAGGQPFDMLPVMDKAGFMRHFEAINTRGIRLEDAMRVALEAEASRDFSPMVHGVTVGLSTGTSGNRGLFLASHAERARWVACVLDRVIGLSLRHRKVAFFLRANSNLYQAVESQLLAFHFFDILQPPDTCVGRLNDLQPDILVAQPSMLCLLAGFMQEGLLRMRPGKVISVAEVLTDEDRLLLERVFGQRIHQVYQCTEGFLAASCRHGTLHFNEDFLIVEKKYIDPDGRRFHPIITDLARTTQPVVRYELNDLIVPKTEACPCGKSFLAIHKIEGRADDILHFVTVEGGRVPIFPDVFRRCIVLADEAIADYALLRVAPTQLLLFVKSEKHGAFEAAAAAVTHTLQGYGVAGVTVGRLADDPHVQGTKKRRIRNECKEAI